MSLADALTQTGIQYAPIVIAECERNNVPVPLVCVLLVKESGVRLPDGSVIYGAPLYGHDTGACSSQPGYNYVTEENYAEYLACVQAGGKRNGVGPMQLTHYSLQDEADAEGGCWDPEVNLRVGVRQVGRLLRSAATLTEAQATGNPVEWVVFRRYNGKTAYADDAMTKLPHWQRIVQEANVSVLVIQMGHVGRPPCPGSQGTAGEQDFTRRAADACVRLLHGKGGWTVKVIDADPNYSAVPKFGGNPEYYRGDAFVAIHCDGSTNPDRDGASFGYRSGGAGFARDIKAAYLRRTGRPATWCEPDNYTTNLSQYYGTGLATQVGNSRAVIMECGFLTNPTDKAMLLAASGPDNVALAIGDALGITAPTPTEDDMLADERNALLSIYKAVFWGKGEGAPYADGPSILARLEALAGQSAVVRYDQSQLDELRAKLRADIIAAESEADANRLLDQIVAWRASLTKADGTT